jgi:hypothetical protein
LSSPFQTPSSSPPSTPSNSLHQRARRRRPLYCGSVSRACRYTGLIVHVLNFRHSTLRMDALMIRPHRPARMSRNLFITLSYAIMPRTPATTFLFPVTIGASDQRPISRQFPSTSTTDVLANQSLPLDHTPPSSHDRICSGYCMSARAGTPRLSALRNDWIDASEDGFLPLDDSSRIRLSRLLPTSSPRLQYSILP